MSPRPNRKRLLAQLLAVLAFPGFVAFQVSGSAAAAACSWQVVDSPRIQGHAGSKLMGVEATGTSDAWAVGALSSTGGNHRTLAEHWNGSNWKIVTTPNATGGDNGFNGVTALSPNDVWAVGYAQQHSNFNTLVAHWNGSAWTIFPSPARGITSSLVGAVNTGTDVWAVGTFTDSSGVRPLIERWNGSSS